jgi:hypothetical protein
MEQRIIYPNDEGGVSVIVPAPECGFTIEEIAAKGVPAGKPFKIVNITDFPLVLDSNGNPVLDEYGVVIHDRTFRGAWEYTE